MCLELGFSIGSPASDGRAAIAAAHNAIRREILMDFLLARIVFHFRQYHGECKQVALL
jgi:tryptophan synthase alpha subunit